MIVQELLLVLPEIVISIMACLILILGAFLKKKDNYIIYYICLFTNMSIIYIINILLEYNIDDKIFDGSISIDNFTLMLKMIIIIFASIIIICSQKYISGISLYKGEYFTLVMFAILGMMVLISSWNFLTLYLGLELLSLSLCVLISLSRKYFHAQEAAIKYFIMSSVSSGLLLFGISLIYGITNTIDFSKIGLILNNTELQNNMILKIGLIFIISGIIFKFGAVPFHMWVPDVYHGAPVPITILISTLPKIAIVGIFYKLFIQVFHNMSHVWCYLIMLVSIASIFFGNFIAISQSNIKRMLAYSAIANIGFILSGTLVSIEHGYIPVLFYTIIYILNSFGMFLVIMLFSYNGLESENINDFKGLWQKKPFLSFIICVLLFSLIGIPPTAGFYAKFLILRSLVESGHVAFVIFALIMSVIGGFYYLNIIRVIFFEKQISNINVSINYGLSNTGFYILIVNGLCILCFGIVPTPILKICMLIL